MVITIEAHPSKENNGLQFAGAEIFQNKGVFITPVRMISQMIIHPKIAHSSTLNYEVFSLFLPEKC